MRAVVIVLLVLATACSGRSKNNDDSSGDAGEDSGGTTAGGSGGSSGSTSGASSGGSSTGGAGGTSPTTGGTSTGGTSATGGTSTGGQAGEAGMGAGGSGMSGGGGAAGASGCEEPAPGGCPTRRCPENQTCQLASGRCIPSRCDCANGEWVCTEDCGGGVCVETSSCMTPDPSGCERNEDCASGEVCTQPTITVCIPVGCACAPLGGEWQCREECGGGVCTQAMCPSMCEPQPGGLCGDEQITWVCSLPGPLPVQEFLDGGCTDAFTQVPRYCCPPTFKPECQ